MGQIRPASGLNGAGSPWMHRNCAPRTGFRAFLHNRVLRCGAGLVLLALPACDTSGRLLFERSESALQGDAGDGDGSGGSGDGQTLRDAAVAPDPDLDPDVEFAWKQTLPGGGECSAGDYVGTYTCKTAEVPIFSGVTTFSLVPGASETSLLIGSGVLELVDATAPGDGDAPVLLRAPLVGELDCTTNGFGAVATDPQQLVGGLPLGYLAPIASTIEGELSRQSQEISGTITIAGGLGSCAGRWTARRAP